MHHDPAQLWKDLPLDEKESIIPPQLKKIILFIIGLFIILLMVSYIFVTFPIGDIIQGKTQSTLLQENMLVLPEFVIIFQNNTASALETLYMKEQKEEFSVCLQGNFNNGMYSITSFYSPQTYQRTFSHVTFESCTADTVIMLHSHPYKRCTASQTDVDTLAQSKERNPEMLMVVMCEPRRFAVYS
ncbi:MAG: hypothetical protein Q7K45_07470 [Nanoarchaeota archaeon]|nr:hypothetical protein [Nanoarchaeota archaeon]